MILTERTPYDVLKKYFGFSEFRPKQLEIIRSVLDGKDTLGILPTGGGKSLCFQIPTLMQTIAGSPGLCLVITPLVALMKDQVENLKKRDILAAALHAGMSREQQLTTLDNCIFGDYRFLYVSPERLSSSLFLTKFPYLSILLLVVDEAHCISQWGFDFRPAYLTIPNIRKKIQAPVLALTATATEKTATIIQRELQFPQPNVIRHSFKRPNIFYAVLETKDKNQKLLKILQRVQGSALVYVRTRNKSVELSHFINAHLGGADFYHAGLDHKERAAKQNAWTLYDSKQKDETAKRIMVCTNAFGMGINKSNVRVVVHFDIPDSLEAYYQEAGRAGRDNQPSVAAILYDPATDKSLITKRPSMVFPEVNFINNVYNKTLDYLKIGLGSGRGHAFSLTVKQMCKVMQLPIFQTYAALDILNNHKYIIFDKQYEVIARVKINVQREILYECYFTPLQEDLMMYLMRNFTAIFTDLQYIPNIDKSLYSGQTPPTFLHEDVFISLAKRKIITYVPPKITERIELVSERQEEIAINLQAYEDQKKSYMERLNGMMQYVDSKTECRENIILNYFAEDADEYCRHCDNCKKMSESIGE